MSPTKRKSNRELQLTASHQNADEEVVQPGIPDPPETLTDEERIVWDGTVELLFQAGRLTKLDGGSIAAYCRAVCLWNKAFADLQAAGPYQQTGSGTKKLSAELSNYNACDRTYERWCVQLCSGAGCGRAIPEDQRYCAECAKEHGARPSRRSLRRDLHRRILRGRPQRIASNT